MTKVHAQSSKPSTRISTVRTRRKNPRPITCSGCGVTAADMVGIGCRCLSEYRLYREAVRHLPELVKSGRGLAPAPVVYLAARRRARAALEQIVALEEQRAREQAAYHAFVRNLYENPHPRFAASRDREILEHLFGFYRRSCSPQSLEDVAAKWSRPVAYVRDLRDRCLEALRHWPTEKRAAGSRRAA
ncbi:MAG: hypothetical protein ABUS79_14945 [Pseudomonadota bacterium]